MKLYNTSDASIKPPVLMLVYGQGGVGKTTFTSTAPKPLLADCENGSKYFGLRGIHMDVALIESWSDIQEFYKLVKESKHETVVIDPIGELMEKLKNHLLLQNQSKFVQRDGSLTMAGWGEMKEKMRSFIKAIKDLGKHVILVAHVEEKEDEGRLVKKPKIMTKMSEELIALVDIVGMMEVIKAPNQATGELEEKRIIRVQPTEKYEGKDRTGQLGAVIEPDFGKIIDACQGNQVFKWSSPKAIAANEKKNKTPEAPQEPDEPKDEPKPEAPKNDKLAKALKK